MNILQLFTLMVEGRFPRQESGIRFKTQFRFYDKHRLKEYDK